MYLLCFAYVLSFFSFTRCQELAIDCNCGIPQTSYFTCFPFLMKLDKTHVCDFLFATRYLEALKQVYDSSRRQEHSNVSTFMDISLV